MIASSGMIVGCKTGVVFVNIVFFGKNNFRIQLALFAAVVALTSGNIIFAFLTSGVWQDEMSSQLGMLVFTAIVAVSYVSGQYMLNAFLKQVDSNIIKRKIRSFHMVEKIIRISQYAIGATLLVLIMQTLFWSEYYAVLPITVLLISFVSAAITSSILTYKLFSWYRQNHARKTQRDLVILLFGLSTAALSLGLGAVLTVNSTVLLANSPVKITPHAIGGSFDNNENGPSPQTNPQAGGDSPTVILLRNTILPFRISFILIWIGSTILLRPYSKTIGKLKYWIIISLPLATNLIAYFHASLSPAYQLSDRLVLVLSSTAGGILVSIIFLVIARNVSKEGKSSRDAVVNYLSAASYGTALVVISLLSPVLFMPYPPIGVASWSLVGLATFMVSIGIYSSAVSVSIDNNLRAMIRRNVIAESAVLGSLGAAQMQQDIQKKVLKIAKQQEESMKEDTGIKTSLSDEEMKEYLETVINEIKKTPARDT